MTTCPSCGCHQPDGLLCVDDTTHLHTLLAAAPALLEQLDLAAAKQTKVGSNGKAGKGTAHERSLINWGAVAVRDHLATEAAYANNLTDPRRHPDAARTLARLATATRDAYNTIDRTTERRYLGTCYTETDGNTCHAELWARPGAHQTTCRQCHTTHNVTDRRAWLLTTAADLLVTAKEASRYLGEVGHIPVTEASIRGYIHRRRLTYRPGTNLIRLGDLLQLLTEANERKATA